MHAVSLLWTVGLIVGSCVLGRRWRDARPDLEQRLAFGWGGFLICVNLWSIVYWSLPGTFDVRESLPLQLCDIACLLAPLVYMTAWRWPRTLLYFWGIGLSTQAFLTPTLQEGPGHMKYYLFWLVHLGIVGTAIYEVVVRRYRPQLRDLLVATAISIGYLGAMLVVNPLTDGNYGYVANTRPDRPTIIDKLGPWPGRVAILTAIVLAIFTALWGAWRLVPRKAEPSQA
jgi:hypothetical integral membrane protein (TIGR02206 family)